MPFPRIFFWSCISFGAGVAFHLSLPVWYHIFSLVLLLLGILIFRRSNFLFIMILLGAFLIGSFYAYNFFNKKSFQLKRLSKQKNISLLVTQRKSQGKGVLLETIELKTLEPILIRTKSFPVFNVGDFISVKGELQNDNNQGSFFYPIISRIKPEISSYLSWRKKIIIFFNSIRLFIIFKIDQLISEPFASLVTALLIGSGGLVPYSIIDQFTKTGIIHIIALSGFNITIIVAFLIRIFNFLSKKQLFLLITSVLVTFIFISGAPASLLRAALMGWLFVLAPLVGRKENIEQALIFAFAFFLFISPSLAYDIGFQLSFAAMLGLVYVTPIFELPIKRRVPAGLAPILATTLGAEFAVMPLILYHFGTISLIAPITNLLVLPIISILQILSLVWLSIGIVSSIIIFPVTLIIWLLISYILSVSGILASLPYASVSLGKIPFWLLCVITIYLITWIIHVRKIQNL